MYRKTILCLLHLRDCLSNRICIGRVLKQRSMLFFFLRSSFMTRCCSITSCNGHVISILSQVVFLEIETISTRFQGISNMINFSFLRLLFRQGLFDYIVTTAVRQNYIRIVFNNVLWCIFHTVILIKGLSNRIMPGPYFDHFTQRTCSSILYI